MTDLHLLLELDDPATKECVEECLRELKACNHCENETHGTPIDHIFDVGRTEKNQMWAKTVVKKARLRVITRLLRNWQRHFAYMHQTMPPVQILSFCKQITDFEFNKHGTLANRASWLKNFGESVLNGELASSLEQIDCKETEEQAFFFRERVQLSLMKSLSNIGNTLGASDYAAESVKNLVAQQPHDEESTTNKNSKSKPSKKKGKKPEPREISTSATGSQRKFDWVSFLEMLDVSLDDFDSDLLTAQEEDSNLTIQLLLKVGIQLGEKTQQLSWVVSLLQSCSSCLLNNYEQGNELNGKKVRRWVEITADFARKLRKAIEADRLFKDEKTFLVRIFLRLLKIEVDALLYPIEFTDVDEETPLEPAHASMNSLQNTGVSEANATHKDPACNVATTVKDLTDRIKELTADCKKTLVYLHDCRSISSNLDSDPALGILLPSRSKLVILTGRLMAGQHRLKHLTTNTYAKCRSAWLRPISQSQDKSKAAHPSNNAQPILFGYSEVFRELQAAKNGLPTNEPTTIASCELNSATVALNCADELLCIQSSPENIRTARAKLLTAKSYLESAKSWLVSGSKSISAWRLYSGLVIRLSCRLVLSRIPDLPLVTENTTLKEFGVADEIVRRGLKATRDGIDHTPPSASAYYREFYLYWHDLMISALCYGIMLSARYPNSKQRSLSRIIDLFRDYWSYSNACEDIRISDFPRWYNIIDSVCSNIDTNLPIENSTNAAKICRSLLNEAHERTSTQRWWESIRERWENL